ncbi:MAG: HAD family hydrolase [Candidatus Vogelbacteria bacterium]|nr:HAD family hydrolase [Candidatus Vogelbacteria bacterium]
MKPVLFCDFDGVLCFDRYWRSLPLDKYEQVQDFIFRNDKTLVNDWMRGHYSAEEINKKVAEKVGVPYDELWDLFVEDCRTMTVSREILGRLNNLRDRFIVMLITGNMDSFSRFTHPSLDLDKYFDHISNSFHEGMHKTDNDGELFLKYVEKYNVPIKNCIVLDDSNNVCKVFAHLGGTAYLVTSDKSLEFYLNNL